MVPLLCALSLARLPSSWSCATGLRRRTPDWRLPVADHRAVAEAERHAGAETAAFDTGRPRQSVCSSLYPALHRASDVPLRPLCLCVYHTLRMSANTHLCLRKERGGGGWRRRGWKTHRWDGSVYSPVLLFSRS